MVGKLEETATPLHRQTYAEADTALLPRARPISSAVSIPFVFLFRLCPFSCPKPPMSAQERERYRQLTSRGETRAQRTDWSGPAVQHCDGQLDDSSAVP